MDIQDQFYIKRLDLFNNLNASTLDKIINAGDLIELEKNSILCKEGDIADYFYVLLDGSLAVIKKHAITNHEYQISVISSGKSIGEIALIASKARTATIKVIENSRLFRISIKKFTQLIYQGHEKNYPYLPLLRSLEKNLVERLQQMNNEKVSSMENEIIILNERVTIITFLVYVISIISLYSFFTQWLMSLMRTSTESTYVTLPMMAILGISVAYPASKLGFSLQDVGIRFSSWSRSVYEPILFTIPILIIMTFVKIYIVTTVPQYSHLPVIDLIDTNALASGSYKDAIKEAIILNICYLLIVVPVQEFISRGVLQTSLARFLVNKHNQFYAIIVSNLIFSAFHTFLSVPIAIITFFLGLYFGFLYYRSNTLIATFISHGLIGFWGLSMLNVLTLTH